MQTHIQIKLFAGLKERTPRSPDYYPIESGTTVQQLLDQLQISSDQKLIVFINSKIGKRTTRLTDGDRIAIMPPVGGG